MNLFITLLIHIPINQQLMREPFDQLVDPSTTYRIDYSFYHDFGKPTFF